jgi:hypothetical protein
MKILAVTVPVTMRRERHVDAIGEPVRLNLRFVSVLRAVVDAPLFVPGAIADDGLERSRKVLDRRLRPDVPHDPGALVFLVEDAPFGEP